MKTKLNERSIKINGITEAFDALSNLNEEIERQKNFITESSNRNYPSLDETIETLKSAFEQLSIVDSVDLAKIAGDIQDLIRLVVNNGYEPIHSSRYKLKKALPQLDI